MGGILITARRVNRRNTSAIHPISKGTTGNRILASILMLGP